MSGPRAPLVAGWLARTLVSAEHNLRDAERQVEGFLSALFVDGWQGWAFVRGANGGVLLDVYEATETPAAVAALIRAGFTTVILHNHKPSKVATCVCVHHEASP